MKARIAYACQPAAPGADYDIEDIHMDVDLPLAPTVGMSLKLNADSGYLPVADVFLDLSPGGEGLVVGLKEPADAELRPWPEMQAAGWQMTHPD